MPTVRFLVTGRVQGVFFRASTRAEALRLGIAGVARNLDDGRVEVVAIGPDIALAALERWLQRGPPAARVADVSREPVDDRDGDGFSIA
jgi:acylphosphatase